MIYVDYLKKVADKFWCHCWSDSSLEELHNFAKKIGVKRCWFENKRGKSFPHYDLNYNQRSLAIINGAKQISLKEYLRNK